MAPQILSNMKHHGRLGMAELLMEAGEGANFAVGDDTQSPD